jgi:transcription initiation factor TFIIIB Brf1 subunit/transcription initiation factor TFIIB
MYLSEIDIPKEAGVTEVTIGSTLKDLMNHLDFN